ncbi:hypothetical protein J6590_098617, partial [Homalodisca vitripennis]
VTNLKSRNSGQRERAPQHCCVLLSLLQNDISSGINGVLGQHLSMLHIRDSWCLNTLLR